LYSLVSVKCNRLEVLEKRELNGVVGMKGQERHELEEISQTAS
jgi:hypothetical protein